MINRIEIVFFLVVTIFVCFLILFKNKGYEVSVEFKINSLSCEYIDNNIAVEIKKELLKNSKIKEVISFSFDESLALYCKISPFVFGKDEVIFDIKNKINLYVQNHKFISSFEIDDKYNLEYSHLMIIKNSNYFELKKNSDEILKTILEEHFLEDIKIFGIRKIVNYIYYSSADLLKFDIDLKDIKKIISENNVDADLIDNIKSDLDNGNIKTIEDIKNIVVPYKNKNFSTRLGDIFKIEKDTESFFDTQVYLGDKNAIVYALSKRKNYPKLLFYYHLWKIRKEHKIEILNVNKIKEIEIYFNEASDIQEIFEFYKKIKNNFKSDVLYFISNKLPNYNGFSYVDFNRLIIYADKTEYKKIKKYLSENKILISDKKPRTIKNTKLLYKIRQNGLNDYSIQKEELINSIKAFKNGYHIGSYYFDEDETEIILKNMDKNCFIYSKKYKNLIDVSSLIDIDLKTGYKIIAKKNFKIQNPP